MIRPAALITAFFIFFTATTTARLFSLDDQNLLIQSIEFAIEGHQPGAVAALRLKSDAPDLKYRVCFRQECSAITKQWLLLPTDPDFHDDQTFVFSNINAQGLFGTIHLEKGLFDRVKDKVTDLRLPSSFASEMTANQDLSRAEALLNRMIYTHWLERPWGHAWQFPIDSKVTSKFGSYRKGLENTPYSHKGLDLRAPVGTPVYAASDGVIISTSQQVVSGNVIVIDHGYGVMSRYLHLSEFKVKEGEEVKAGQLIGLAGTSGRSEAPHLHWEMRVRGFPVDPPSTVQLLARLTYSE